MKHLGVRSQGGGNLPCHPTGKLLQAAHGSIAELLHAAASILVAFLIIPPCERATLMQAFHQMAAIYEPASNVHHKFATRKIGETKTSLA
ncbi:unnamed protein product [Lampetra fluviatilis]